MTHRATDEEIKELCAQFPEYSHALNLCHKVSKVGTVLVEGDLRGVVAAEVAIPATRFVVNDDRRRCLVRFIYVTESSRKNGLGTRLMDEIKQFAKGNDCYDMSIAADYDSGTAAFLERIGFFPKKTVYEIGGLTK